MGRTRSASVEEEEAFGEETCFEGSDTDPASEEDSNRKYFLNHGRLYREPPLGDPTKGLPDFMFYFS